MGRTIWRVLTLVLVAMATRSDEFLKLLAERVRPFTASP
jgi:hypothetical protein